MWIKIKAGLYILSITVGHSRNREMFKIRYIIIMYMTCMHKISKFGILNFRLYRTTVNGPATINANKCIGLWLISNLGYKEPLAPAP